MQASISEGGQILCRFAIVAYHLFSIPLSVLPIVVPELSRSLLVRVQVFCREEALEVCRAQLTRFILITGIAQFKNAEWLIGWGHFCVLCSIAIF